jgi:hypothetical protein
MEKERGRDGHPSPIKIRRAPGARRSASVSIHPSELADGVGLTLAADLPTGGYVGERRRETPAHFAAPPDQPPITHTHVTPNSLLPDTTASVCRQMLAAIRRHAAPPWSKLTRRCLSSPVQRSAARILAIASKPDPTSQPLRKRS